LRILINGIKKLRSKLIGGQSHTLNWMPKLQFKYRMDSNVHFLDFSVGVMKILCVLKTHHIKIYAFQITEWPVISKETTAVRSILQEEIFRLRTSPVDATFYRSRPKGIRTILLSKCPCKILSHICGTLFTLFSQLCIIISFESFLLL
jgi:hypothetical protein